SAAAGNVTFTSAVNGGNALTVSSTGTTQFSGAIGTITPLAGLTTDAGGTTRINGGTVTSQSTNGDQTHSDAGILGTDTVLSGNDVTFSSTVNADGTPRTLTINTSNNGVTTFNAAVGGTSPLAGLTTNADGTTRIGGGAITTVAATGDQTYGDAV